ncbi:hypothetical protein MMC27_002218 [Xylographa pallens]|nr:hypothetical protein [Xylographa pallens]
MPSKSLTNLPQEIVNLILEACLVASSPVVIPYFFGSLFFGEQAGLPIFQQPWEILPSVLSVCRSFHDVGIKYLYQKNHFHFRDPDGLVSFGDAIGKSNAELVSQISIQAVNQEFLKEALVPGATFCFENLKRITLDRRRDGSVTVDRSTLGPIPYEEKLEKAIRNLVGPDCQITTFPPN